MLVDKVTIDLNVYGTFMEEIIMGNIDGTLVTAIERGGALILTHMSRTRWQTHTSLDVMWARESYSASMEE